MRIFCWKPPLHDIELHLVRTYNLCHSTARCHTSEIHLIWRLNWWLLFVGYKGCEKLVQRQGAPEDPLQQPDEICASPQGGFPRPEPDPSNCGWQHVCRGKRDGQWHGGWGPQNSQQKTEKRSITAAARCPKKPIASKGKQYNSSPPAPKLQSGQTVRHRVIKTRVGPPLLLDQSTSHVIGHL